MLYKLTRIARNLIPIQVFDLLIIMNKAVFIFLKLQSSKITNADKI